MAEAVKGLSSGLRVLTDRSFLLLPKYQEQQWRANRVGAHPKMLLFEKKLIARFETLGIPMFTHCFVRTHEQQKKEYEEGDSKSPPGQGVHEFGMGFDLIHSVAGWNLAPESWKMVRHIGNEVAAQNGIPLRHDISWDPAHWELADWRKYKDGFPFSGVPS